MEMRYFLEKWIPGETAVIVEILIVLLIAGGWIPALFVTAGGKGNGSMFLLAFSAFTFLIGLYNMQFVLFYTMPWPERLMIIVMLLAGLIATVAMAAYRRRTRKAIGSTLKLRA